MSTVPDKQESPIQYAPKAGNTVESLTPKAVVPNVPTPVPVAPVVDKPKTEAPVKTEATVVNKAKEAPLSTVTRLEFQELADAVQELAERIKRYNAVAPFKIPE